MRAETLQKHGTGHRQSDAAPELRLASLQMPDPQKSSKGTAVNFIYRLVKYGGAKRVLFLVDRGNLGEQTLKEFQQFVSPVNNYKFTEEYIVQHLTSNTAQQNARARIPHRAAG
jgi:hypothetical protein